MIPSAGATATRPRVVHLTSVHAPLDDRIFYRECLTLANAGYDVAVIAPGSDHIVVNGIRIIAVPTARGRAKRMTKTTWNVYRAALEEAPAIYHFHDPELIPAGLMLRLKGMRVVYDVHEDVPEDVMTKQWIPGVLRPIASWLIALLHRLAAGRFSATISATSKIAQRLPSKSTVVIHNYPLQNENDDTSESTYSRERPHNVVYIGSISKIRGVLEIVTAMSLVTNPPDARLVICGTFEDHKLETEVRQNAGWHKVDSLGWRDRHEIKAVLRSARAGLLLFHPGPNHDEALPAKLFEYMAAGLPIIASDFPLWRTIIDEAGCGVLVNPLDPAAISEAISYTLMHPDEAERMGDRGKAAVAARYNWSSEESKLLQLYEKLG
jgi:glycosyltransferase involved in cell wall biosynthesis